MLSRSTVVWVTLSTIALFLVFVAIAFNVDTRGADDFGIAGTAAKMQFAFAWTFQLAGSLVAILAAIQLIRIVGQGDQASRIVPASLAVLGGLLLTSQHWVLVVAFGALGLAMIAQQLLLQRHGAPVDRVGSGANTQASVG